MIDYVGLPSQQLSNLVKRYVQFRRATELEGKISYLDISMIHLFFGDI